jgi:adenosine deaminase
MSIKKAELHVHLEGTILPAMAKKLAQRNSLQLPDTLIAADGNTYIYKDFMDFLKAYDQVAALIMNPIDYYDITLDYLKNRALEHCIYVEMMYSPEHAEQATGIPSIEHLKAIQEAINYAESQFGIMGRIIVTAVRHFGVDNVIKVAKKAINETVPCIVGFGLAGDEANFPPKLFKEAYDIAHGAGLPCTVHAGEFASAEGMMEAMDYLPIKRIGHGVQAIHSAETIARLKDNNIALEVCPSSNIKLGLFKDLAHHPLPQLVEQGLALSLNSDDPPFFHTTLGQEYEKTQQFYKYSDSEMQNFTKMAIEHAFVEEETKKRLLAQL